MLASGGYIISPWSFSSAQPKILCLFTRKAKMAIIAEIPDIRASELKALYESKAGVKGLVDLGLTKIPKIFIHPAESFTANTDSGHALVEIPVIDLDGIHGHRRKEIVEEIRVASETWGFFRIINHGIPIHIMDAAIEGIRRFNEQLPEVKAKYHSQDLSENVRIWNNYDQYLTKAGNWRDTLCLYTAPQDTSQEVPIICRDILNMYAKEGKILSETLLELLSEALGLSPDHLKNMGCNIGQSMICHYYPACPEPELTLGATKHTDPTYLGIVLQDHIGGFQLLHQQQWIDVPHVHGALLINIGDFLQIISNDKFKSVEHRVLANIIGPRISLACFTFPDSQSTTKVAPIKELLSDDHPPIFREVGVKEYAAAKHSKFFLGKAIILDEFKL